ncbi:MAG: hypothetical protein IJT92_07700 [Spirochaetia bacterium]|nr:hypothetical protein [Spirochaetia bacterium]
MERNPGAWRKMAGLLILLALCILPCGAETSNRQRIIALDSEVYQDIDALYMMNGFAPPSYARPWSEDEIDHILSKLQPEKLTGPAKLAYENIQKKLSKKLLFGKEEKAFASISGTVNLEGFFKTNDDRKEWVHGYEERLPLFDIPFEFWLWDHMYIDVDLSIREAHDVLYDSDYDYSNIPENIKYIDPSIPYRAFMSVGGRNWNVQMGRDKISWGNGETGNMVLSDWADWYNFIKFTTYWKVLKFSFVYAGLESYLTPEEKEFDKREQGDGLVQGNYENFRERYKAFLAHRLEARITDKFTMAATEGIIFGNKYPEFGNMNPVSIFHSVFAPEYSNVIFSLEADYAIFRGFDLYAQVAMDEMKLSIENSESARPTALGYMLGTRYLFPAGDGIVKLTLEGAYTDPYLYNRWHPLTRFTVRRRYWSYLDDGYLYLDKATGYRYGPDAVVGYLAGEYRIPSNLMLKADITLKYLGEKNTSLSEITSYHTDKKTTPTGTVERELDIGLHADKVLSRHFSVGGDMYYVNIDNFGNVSGETINDFEFALHFSYKF